MPGASGLEAKEKAHTQRITAKIHYGEWLESVTTTLSKSQTPQTGEQTYLGSCPYSGTMFSSHFLFLFYFI